MNMYQIGDKVLYGMHGVCVVIDLEKRTLDGKQVTYLVLEPAGQSGSRFLVPSHNAAAMAKQMAQNQSPWGTARGMQAPAPSQRSEWNSTAPCG